MRSSARWCAVLVAVAVTAASLPTVHAQTAAEITAARELFEEGIKLEEKGQWVEALERFRKVAAVKTTPQVRFHIALCLENSGKLVDALVEFQRAQADAAGDPAASNVAANAAKHIADLKERIPRVIVKIPSGIDGATVTIDDVPVTPSLVGTALPLDPGAHTIVVQAPTRSTFTKTFELVERGKPLTIEAALPSAEANHTVVDDDGTADERPTSEKPGNGASALPWVFGGIGVAALIGGGVMYGLRQGTISDIRDQCPNDTCPESARADVQTIADRGKTYTTYGNVLLGVGVLGVATAAVLLIVAPGSPEKAASAKKAPWTIGSGPGVFGVSLSGSF